MVGFEVPAWVLWLQAGYSLWTFLRNAKFLRIPFITLSMLWHGHDRIWFRNRSFLLLDGQSRETGGDWSSYDNEEEKKSHSFSIENNYDMRFKLNEKDYRFCSSFETGKPLKFLHFAKRYQIVTEDIILMGRYHLVKAVKPEAMLNYVLTGGTLKTCEEYCIVDNTSRELLNDNFMRILSIIPLALQAKGFDQFSTLVSAILVIMDLFSFYFNFIWQACKALTFKYTKVFLAKLNNVKYRVFLHELLNTGSDSFMYCDDSMKKSYYKTIEKFMVVRGCEIPLDATTAVLSTDGDLLEQEEIRMNLNIFLVETELVAEGLYNITISDSNHNKEKREYLSKSLTIKIVNYLKFCAETGNYPFRHISKNSVHVVNPIKAMVDGVFEWVLTVQLKHPVKMFISDSTIAKESVAVEMKNPNDNQVYVSLYARSEVVSSLYSFLLFPWQRRRLPTEEAIYPFSSGKFLAVFSSDFKDVQRIFMRRVALVDQFGKNNASIDEGRSNLAFCTEYHAFEYSLIWFSVPNISRHLSFNEMRRTEEGLKSVP